MSRMRLISTVSFVCLTFAAGAAFAQTAPPARPPQTPPATPAQKPAVPANPPAAATAPTPVPLPEGTKVAIIDPDIVASESVLGKQIMSQLKTLSDKKNAELTNIQTQMQALQTKKTQQGAMLTQAAQSQIDKDIERLNLDLQYKQQSASKEVQDLQTDLFNDLSQKMAPVLEAYAKEKGLLIVLDSRQGPIWAAAGMDISLEIVKRLDAATKK